MDNDIFTVGADMPPEKVAAIVKRELDKFLYSQATPKERYYMRHTKKRRVIQKYRNRVLRRLIWWIRAERLA